MFSDEIFGNVTEIPGSALLNFELLDRGGHRSCANLHPWELSVEYGIRPTRLSRLPAGFCASPGAFAHGRCCRQLGLITGRLRRGPS